MPKRPLAGRLGRLLRNGPGALALSLCFSGEALAEQPVFDSLTVLEPPTSGIAQEPYLAVVGQSLLISWMVPTASETLVQFARFDDVGWSNPVTVGRGEDIFVNWADFPTVAAFGDSGIALHWLRKAGRSSYGYHVELSLSNDLGRSWSDPIVPYSDRSDQQHGFVTMSGNSDGALDLLWLDARNYGQTGLLARPDVMQLRATRIDAHGRLETDGPVDTKTCSCCQTSSARLGDGTLVVAYRDRTEAEIRDISIVRLIDDAWTDPINVHPDGWEISGCPVNGPAVAAQGDRIAVAWFTAARMMSLRSSLRFRMTQPQALQRLLALISASRWAGSIHSSSKMALSWSRGWNGKVTTRFCWCAARWKVGDALHGRCWHAILPTHP